MTQTLEWFQCKACGRRHRWQAETAGTEVQCACGRLVFCPELEVFGDPDASDTIPGGELEPDEAEGFAEVVGIEGEEAAAPRYQRKRGSGLFGMGSFGELVFWTVGAAIGFALLVHALIVQWWWYIALTVIWCPISFAKFWKKKKRWQGNRSLMRALEEQFDGQ